ncbi:MAG: hypothetical protein IT379_42225 [Deltaproteobacteria bacterium]|nr:hypothetical protein [Deltaproteobacteria bacterium]
MTRRGRFHLVGAVAALLVVSCGGEDGSTAAPTCDAPLAVDQDSQSVKVDTRGADENALQLRECWGADAALSGARQAVLAYTAPGVGQTRTRIDVEAVTGMDAVLAIRRGGCSAPTEARCYDLGQTGSITIPTMGGETLHVLVTGRATDTPGTVDSGEVRVTFLPEPASAPRLDSAYVEVFQGRMFAELTGQDADGDVMGALFRWMDASGDVIALDALTADERDLVTFDADERGSTSFETTATALDYTALETADVRAAEIVLLDELGNESAPERVEVVRPMEVHYQDSCDSPGEVPPFRRCARQLVCREGTCQAPTEIEAACAAATPVEIPTPTTETTAVRDEGELVPGAGVIHGLGACERAPGLERMYRVVVPEGRFDLIARTDVNGRGEGYMEDDLIYFRRDCLDPGSQPAEGGCIDSGPRSRLELLDAEPGTYTVFVEDFDGVDAGDVYPYVLELALRPVLASGAACDPEGLRNRCAGGPCSAGETCP